MGDDGLRDRLVRRLLEAAADIPTSTLGRLGRTGAALVRGGWLARRRGDDALDERAIARIVEGLGELKGVAMKAGQLASYVDVALPEALRSALAALQTHSQAMPLERVRAILRAELGDRAAVLAETLEPRPIAAASIGQVHRARLPDGTAVAVKVQYPEIEAAIEADFGPAAAGARFAALLFPHARVDAFVREAKSRFLEECDYEHEAAAQERFGAIYAADPVITVPAVHRGWSTRRVLTTTFVDGIGLDAFLASDPAPEIRDRLGRALFDFYVGTLFRHHIYDCDPHPGNAIFRSNGTVALLDYGCVRAFEPEFVGKLAALARAVHADERDALHRAFVDLGMVEEGGRYDFETARALVRAFHGPMLRDEFGAIDLGAARSFRQILDSKRKLMRLSLPGEFLFLFRIRFGLLSVLARLGARANWCRLERELVRATAKAAPERPNGGRAGG
jgi:predicted unusual protein kinase regulating ubiquinone biosynthesis (AarF/ABC1/UbiB family)